MTNLPELMSITDAIKDAKKIRKWAEMFNRIDDVLSLFDSMQSAFSSKKLELDTLDAAILKKKQELDSVNVSIEEKTISHRAQYEAAVKKIETEKDKILRDHNKFIADTKSKTEEAKSFYSREIDNVKREYDEIKQKAGECKDIVDSLIQKRDIIKSEFESMKKKAMSIV